jgi:hypothetical protein
MILGPNTLEHHIIIALKKRLITKSRCSYRYFCKNSAGKDKNKGYEELTSKTCEIHDGLMKLSEDVGHKHVGNHWILARCVHDLLNTIITLITERFNNNVLQIKLLKLLILLTDMLLSILNKTLVPCPLQFNNIDLH